MTFKHTVIFYYNKLQILTSCLHVNVVLFFFLFSEDDMNYYICKWILSLSQLKFHFSSLGEIKGNFSFYHRLKTQQLCPWLYWMAAMTEIGCRIFIVLLIPLSLSLTHILSIYLSVSLSNFECLHLCVRMIIYQ